MDYTETFYGWQGEGPHTGRKAQFVRVWGCNLNCSFCDSKFSWDIKKRDRKDPMPIHILNICDEIPLMIWTGGEPLLYGDEIADVIRFNDRLNKKEHHIETNGTIKPSEKLIENIEFFNISPKEMRYQTNRVDISPKILEEKEKLKGYCVKFVYHDEQSFDFVKEIQKKYDIPNEKIWLMPEGISSKEIIEKLKELMSKEHPYNISLRMQIIAFENKRGV